MLRLDLNRLHGPTVIISKRLVVEPKTFLASQKKKVFFNEIDRFYKLKGFKIPRVYSTSCSLRANILCSLYFCVFESETLDLN